MTKDEKLKLLTEWRDSYMRIEKLSEPLESVFGANLECQFFDTIWTNFDRHTKAASLAIGDKHGWLDWYANDNDMGTKSLAARVPSGKFRKIDTLPKLLKLIEEASNE